MLEELENRMLLSSAWGVSMGGGANDDVGGITADPQGNIIVTGSTRDASWITTPGSSAEGTANAYVAKFTDAGQLVSATTFGFPGFNSGNEVAVDADGSVFIVGHTYGPDPGVNTAFAARFSAAGQLLWATPLERGELDFGYDIALDSAGNAMICGSATTGVARDAFVAKFESEDGQLLWRTQFGSGRSETAYALAVDAQDGIWVVGESYTPPQPVQGGSTSISFSAAEAAESSATMIAYGGFLAHLSADGTYISGGSVGGRAVLDVAVDANGDICMAGVGPGYELATSDAIVTKRRPDGTTVWTRTIDQTTGASAVVVDDNGAIYAAGYTVEKNAPPTPGYPSRAQQKDSGFISGLNADGTVAWTHYLGDRDTVVRALALGPGRIFAGGHTGRWGSSPWTTHDAFVLEALTAPAEAGEAASIRLIPFPEAPAGTVSLTTRNESETYWWPGVQPPLFEPIQPPPFEPIQPPPFEPIQWPPYEPIQLPTFEPPPMLPFPVLQLPGDPNSPRYSHQTLVPSAQQIQTGRKMRFTVFREGTPLGAQDGPVKLFLDTNRNGVIDRKDELVKDAANVDQLVISSRQLPVGRNQILARVGGQTIKTAVTVTESNRPTATLESVTTRRRGQLFFVLANVRYQDDSGIETQTLTTGDIYMRNPRGVANGFWEPRTIERQKDGSVLVQYVTRYVISKQFPLPRGTYVIMLAKDQVSDMAGNWVTAKRLGTFSLAKPITSKA